MDRARQGSLSRLAGCTHQPGGSFCKPQAVPGWTETALSWLQQATKMGEEGAPSQLEVGAEHPHPAAPSELLLWCSAPRDAAALI